MVVLILAIAGALAIPQFGSTELAKLRAAAEMVAADIAFAKIDSLAHGDDPRVIVFDSTNERYHIAAQSDPSTPLTNPVGQTPYMTTFGQGRANALSNVEIDSYSLDGDDMVGFGLFGQLDQTDDATITLSADSATMIITIDATTGTTTISSP